MSGRRLTGVLLTIGLGLTACDQPPSPPADIVCAVMRPITFSANGDTEATIRQIRRHNAALFELCPQLRPAVRD